jgi:hypothetical protein
MTKNVLIVVFAVLFLGCSVSQKSVKEAVSPTASYPAMPASVVAEPQAYPTHRSPPKASAGIGRVVIGEGDAQSNVYSHSYRVLNNLTDVQRLKNTVTYVLLPNNISEHSNKESKKYKRYTQLLELIQELRKTDLSTAPDSVAAKSDNQFVLFSNEEKEKNVDVKNYNYALAHKVLDLFKENYSYSLFSKEGPYLVTVTRNIWTSKSNFTFLYVNMSSFNNSALNEVLASYKERLITKGNDEVSMFERLHSTLLSFLTNLNDDIHIFQSAFAGEL